MDYNKKQCLTAFFIGTASMVLLRQPLPAMVPNFLLFGLTVLGLFSAGKGMIPWPPF